MRNALPVHAFGSNTPELPCVMATFVVPSPPPPHFYKPERLKLLGLLADYVREHDGLATWG